ncbi:MAG: FecR domain-containing protein [Paludibacter sp.]
MKNEFSQLVTKVLAGEASNIEKKLLKQMLQESSENTLMYNQLKEYWNAEVNLTSKRNKDAFETNLLARLNFEPEVKVLKHRKLYLKIASVAAILFFAMTCTMTYLYITEPKELYTYSAQSTPVEYTLEDGTKVTLNKNSNLTFKSDFGEKRRNVKLTGEAFFKVAKDKTRPFTVEAFGTKTEVLGTWFNVKTNKVTSEVSTTLVEGSVQFKADNYNIILKPGEEVVYNTLTKKHNAVKTDVQYNTAWALGRYNYSNITFSEFAIKLGKIYNLKIDISDKKIANRIISASFVNEEPIEKILKALENELGFRFITKDSTEIKIYLKP